MGKDMIQVSEISIGCWLSVRDARDREGVGSLAETVLKSVLNSWYAVPEPG